MKESPNQFCWGGAGSDTSYVRPLCVILASPIVEDRAVRAAE